MEIINQFKDVETAVFQSEEDKKDWEKLLDQVLVAYGTILNILPYMQLETQNRKDTRVQRMFGRKTVTCGFSQVEKDSNYRKFWEPHTR